MAISPTLAVVSGVIIGKIFKQDTWYDHQKSYTSLHNHTMCANLKILPIITLVAVANVGEITILPQIMYQSVHQKNENIHFAGNF